MSPAEVGSTVGTVVRLQLQRSPLKPGPRGQRVYDPAPLLEVEALQLGPRGVVGPEGTLDVHHADHPQTRNVRGGVNGISVLPRAHYAALRAHFGPHAVDGCAGESLLLDTDCPLTEADLAGTLLLDTVDGEPLVLGGAQPAPPCVEFSRWLLQRDVDTPVDDVLQDAMAFLGAGRRGFYLTAEGAGRVVAGARLRRA